MGNVVVIQEVLPILAVEVELAVLVTQEVRQVILVGVDQDMTHQILN